MNGWDEREHGELDVIADAVRTYPLAPLPPGFASAVMARIHGATPKPRFELTWIDVALGLFGASMTGVVWMVWQWLQSWPNWASGLAPNTFAPLDDFDIALGATGVIGGLLVLGVCLIIALIVFVPRPVIRLEPISR